MHTLLNEGKKKKSLLLNTDKAEKRKRDIFN